MKCEACIFPCRRLAAWFLVWLGCLITCAGATVPVSTSPPGGLTPEQTPQMILITFDDAVNASIFADIQKIAGHQNPDGSPVAFTFYVSTNWTDYYLVHQLHAAGHEIAAHTITHSTGDSTPFATWIREIELCREAISHYSGIPIADIRGFRAPYLRHNAAMFEALNELGFDYDCTIPEGPGLNSPDGANYIWPYTLHDGVQQLMWSGDGPSTSMPNLFEVPMWNLLDGTLRHNMDPGGSGEYLLQLFKDNFTQRYEGNRAPWGLWLHATNWLSDQERIDALNAFLEWALEHDDVWVVGVGTLVDWMRNPVSAETAAQNGILGSQTYVAVPESETIFNSFSNGSFRSVNNTAMAYPNLSNVFLRPVAVSGVEVDWALGTQWGASFQVNIRTNHSLTEPLTGWTIQLDVGDAEVTSAWGGPDWSFEDGVLTIVPGWAGAAIPPGENVLMTVGITGTPEDLGTPTGTFMTSGFVPPKMTIEPGSGPNAFRLKWNRIAPIYELERSTTLAEEDWEVVETYYGREEATVLPDAPAVFYRLRAVQ